MGACTVGAKFVGPPAGWPCHAKTKSSFRNDRRWRCLRRIQAERVLDYWRSLKQIGSLARRARPLRAERRCGVSAVNPSTQSKSSHCLVAYLQYHAKELRHERTALAHDDLRGIQSGSVSHFMIRRLKSPTMRSGKPWCHGTATSPMYGFMELFLYADSCRIGESATSRGAQICCSNHHQLKYESLVVSGLLLVGFR
jgi:hypothetical protein